jgi:2-keto-4-pentenoate hydratase
MDAAKAREAASLLWAAFRSRKPIRALPDELRPRNISEGYQIQEAMVGIAGQPAIGWKIGCTSEHAQELLNVDAPFAGRVLANSVLYSPARIKDGTVTMGIVEAEFAFVLGRDLPARPRGYAIEEVIDAVGELRPAIELPDSRFFDWQSVGAPQLIADNGVAALLVLGQPAKRWNARELRDQRVTVTVNGSAVAEGSGANVLGDPCRALAWLTNEMSKSSIGLRAGEIISTGSCADVVQISPGDRIVADFGPIGRVEVHLAT